MRYIKENKITINKNTTYRRNERNSRLSFFITCTTTTKVPALLTIKETSRNSLSPKHTGRKEEFFVAQIRFQLKSNNEF